MKNALDIFNLETKSWFKNSVGSPTSVQEEGWPAILSGAHTLISAPTGAGKTLCAFLVFIDRLKELSRSGQLPNELNVIYISPLKSLGNDIRENLNRPLTEIAGPIISTAVRTGDTSQAERRRIIKTPPHILITTPESLYLMLTSKGGRDALMTAKAVIIDELHALINTKRGAHLMLSLARLDDLCGKKLQRVGLSATVTPLEVAAKYLAGDNVRIIAPKINKKMEISVKSAIDDMRILPEGSIWPEIAKKVYEECQNARSTIAFVEGRLQAEKISYLVNQLGGVAFSRTHHGCVSKEQRLEAEQALKNGSLRLLCATSSMELGIDVGEIDLVLQIGNPRTVTQATQRLGRSGHNPGRTSVMHIYPKTIHESIYCGITAKLALSGDIERITVPEKCLDVMAQHLVSMAAAAPYTEDDALRIIRQAYNFKDVTVEELRGTLCMLAGDFEHSLDNPARPRILYDRINKTVAGDAYSRMLACSAGGTIPDRGYFGVKLEDGTKLGELDEEFVFETRVGDKFMLGSYAWKVKMIDRENVIVTPTNTEGATPPFWKGDSIGRSYETGIKIGKLLRSFNEAFFNGKLYDTLYETGLDDSLSANAIDFITRQIKETGLLPDDKTIIIEHFDGEANQNQIVAHSVFGKRVNLGLAILAQDAARKEMGADVVSFDDDDGFLVSAFGSKEELPLSLLEKIDITSVRETLGRLLPSTPLFNMAFRYNAGRALLMGAKNGRRQPLWIQRLRSAEVLDNAAQLKGHPLIVETTRECMDDYLDLDSIEKVLSDIKTGNIKIHEIQLPSPSPMSLPLRREVEGVMVYDYFPTTSKVRETAFNNIGVEETVLPTKAALEKALTRQRRPENADMLHSVLLTEGDAAEGEIEADIKWFGELSRKGRALYIEPGLWICAEHKESYEAAFYHRDFKSQVEITRRLLRYRGPQSVLSLSLRYIWDTGQCEKILNNLVQTGKAYILDGYYYHAGVYERAQRETINSRRAEIKTYPAQNYAALMAKRLKLVADPETSLKNALNQLMGLQFELKYWESSLLPARVNHYRQNLLDLFLAKGELFWQIDGMLLSFHTYADIDWEAETEVSYGLDNDEIMILDFLKKRGASFINSFAGLGLVKSASDVLLSLAAKGLVHADSFVPVRQIITGGEKLPVKRRVKEKVTAAASGRWDLTRKIKALPMEDILEREFNRSVILCAETVQGVSWHEALEALKIMEYTGRVRRGYFVKGLSGAQFVKERDYSDVILSLESPSDEIIWINAADPFQVWGRIIKAETEQFICVNSTAAALYKGQPAALLERSGGALRVFDYEIIEDVLNEFVAAYEAKRIFPQLNRIVIKKYSLRDEPHLKAAGFSKQMADYVLWRKII